MSAASPSIGRTTREKGRTRYKTMTLATAEFMPCRFLLHVLPRGFHRIRHYGLLANAGRKESLAVARQLLHQPAPAPAKPQAGHDRIATADLLLAGTAARP